MGAKRSCDFPDEDASLSANATDDWRDAAKSAWSAALDVVFPIRCVGCGAAGRFICEPCAEKMPKLERPFCDTCASPGVAGKCRFCRSRPLAVDTIRAPYLYIAGSPIHAAITMLKFGGMRSVAPELAELLSEYLRERPTRFDVVMPTPSHPSRVRRRGYAQAALIAESLAERLGAPFDGQTLRRTADAPSQLETASREGRWANVQGGFSASASNGASVLLIDDLATTGSTASACASALKAAGARRVAALAVARAA